MSFCFRFTHAIVRIPANSITNGLRARIGPDPRPEAFRAQHVGYCEALRNAGVDVEVLPALEAFPDSVFVEDAGLCLPDLGILVRPGAPSRLGETAAIADVIRATFPTVLELQAGTLDGGDVLVTDREILVGLSERTNQAGIDSLGELLAPLNYSVRGVATPAGVLHFKTDCSLLDDNTIFATSALASRGCFAGYTVILAPEGEEEAVNLIRVNDVVIARTGFPKTEALLADAGYRVVTTDTSEAALVDGGLSCMSLRFALTT